MKTNESLTPLHPELIKTKIYIIRSKKVMLDRDLALLYGVKTQVLNQAVRRNLNRFPDDFMFKLTEPEAESLISQFVISKPGRGGSRHLPNVFTEQGIAMLSSVLNSERAIQVNIQIMRTFTKIREMLSNNKELREKIEKLETKYDGQFKIIFEAIKLLITPPDKPKNGFGFK